jgi:hypothetical protein
MSTYYYFACERCREYGGFYSRQMWGWGDADIIATFRFLMHHTGHCGEDKLRVVSEHFEDTGWTHVVPADEPACDDLGERNDYYDIALWPRSLDWIEQSRRAYCDALKKAHGGGSG